MESFQINSNDDLTELFDFRRKNLKQVMSREVQEAVDNEFNLIELNLFISSIGKNKIQEATERVRKLRKSIDSKRLDLSEYEEMAEDF
jgi:hypothetical protein